jgi:hypothetical protein
MYINKGQISFSTKELLDMKIFININNNNHISDFVIQCEKCQECFEMWHDDEMATDGKPFVLVLKDAMSHTCNVARGR